MPEICTVPALIVNGPVKVLVFVKVNLPTPVFVSPPVPLKIPP